MQKAKQKSELQDCAFNLGNAENIPYPTNYFDRYISAGSIEYWPNPMIGIAEAYRVLKAGGVALVIGPLCPQNRYARFIADTWMLFPEEEEYLDWFKDIGFSDIKTLFFAKKNMELQSQASSLHRENLTTIYQLLNKKMEMRKQIFPEQ
jgi:MPBQ/MSBQ methyltransferase